MPTTTEEPFKVLVDTNILVRFVNKQDPQHAIVSESLGALIERGPEIVYTPQNLREFWNVATRPSSSNGLGYSVIVAESLTRRIESLFTLLPDAEGIHPVWRRLVFEYEVKGAKVHDAHLAASALHSGCRAILTFNQPDFRRFGIETVHPRDIEAFLSGS